VDRLRTGVGFPALACTVYARVTRGLVVLGGHLAHGAMGALLMERGLPPRVTSSARRPPVLRLPGGSNAAGRPQDMSTEPKLRRSRSGVKDSYLRVALWFGTQTAARSAVTSCKFH